MAQAHYENFPVASHLLPAAMRPHVAAVYAYARIGDDIADEGHAAPAVRRDQLARWQARLHDAVADPQAALHAALAMSPSGASHMLILAATAQSIRTHALPLSLFDDLLSAFAQDITTTRYASWVDLFDYCRRSANPVGRLVLRIGGYDDAILDRSSDALCTALQLTNFWQDFGRDWSAGRLYVPAEVSTPRHADEDDLRRGVMTAAWADAIRACAERTGQCFDEGRPVCDGVSGRLRFELRLTWLGGRSVLDQAVARGTTLWHDRPALGRGHLPRLAWRAWRWSAA